MASDAIETFVARARESCDFVVHASTLSLAGRLQIARLRLLELYLAAVALPGHSEIGDADADEGPSPEPPPDWPGFGDRTFYWEVFDPYEMDENEPVCGDLSDDVLDTYRDLRRGLDLWDDSHTISAVWVWRFGFDHHWGDHTIDALRALHRACGPS